MAKEHFRPRKMIPKDRLIKYLKEGYTLEEIGKEIGKSRSYISEMLMQYDLKTTEIEGRHYAMKQRRKMLESRSFVDVMFDKIKDEKGGINE